MTMTRTKWIVSAAAALAVCGAAAAAYFCWPRASKSPDPVQAPRENVLQYMASDAFGKLSEDQRKEYLDKVRQRGEDVDLMRQSRDLPEAQQEALRNNVGPLIRRMMQERVEAFFQTPPEQRDAYLDAMLDKMPVMRAEAGGADRAGDRPGGQKARPNFTPDQLRKMIEQTDPIQRAQFAAFMIAMHKRIEERKNASGGGKH